MGSTATSCKQANMDQTFSLLLFVSCQRPTGLGVYPPSPPPPPPPQYPTPAPVQDYNPDIGQAVGLRYAGLVVELVDIVKKDGEVVEIKVKTTSIEQAAKPKAFIHWVAAPVPVTVRMYGRLFKHKTPEDPAVVPGGFLEDIAENTLEEREALADKHLVGSKLYEKFQFERIGFFCVDRDSTQGKLVFNLTVGLKEDAGKV